MGQRHSKIPKPARRPRPEPGHPLYRAAHGVKTGNLLGWCGHCTCTRFGENWGENRWGKEHLYVMGECFPRYRGPGDPNDYLHNPSIFRYDNWIWVDPDEPPWEHPKCSQSLSKVILRNELFVLRWIQRDTLEAFEHWPSPFPDGHRIVRSYCNRVKNDAKQEWCRLTLTRDGTLRPNWKMYREFRATMKEGLNDWRRRLRAMGIDPTK